jgi:hypothetical protein
MYTISPTCFHLVHFVQETKNSYESWFHRILFYIRIGIEVECKTGIMARRCSSHCTSMFFIAFWGFAPRLHDTGLKKCAPMFFRTSLIHAAILCMHWVKRTELEASHFISAPTHIYGVVFSILLCMWKSFCHQWVYISFSNSDFQRMSEAILGSDLPYVICNWVGYSYFQQGPPAIKSAINFFVL